MIEKLNYFINKTFLQIPLYKIAISLSVFLFFLILRKLFSLIIIKTLQKIVSKTKTKLDDKILSIIREPLKFSFIIIGLYISVKILKVDSYIITKFVRTMIIFSIFWLLYAAVKTFDDSIFIFTKKFGKDLHREIGKFFSKTIKIFIIAIGVVAILQDWGINVSAFIASLGLGGLAFALAAKDSAANLFAGLTILADKSLKIDDWINVNGVEGVVEDIGIRSTRVRTFEKSLITIPNQMITNNAIENFSKRNIRRIKMNIGVTYNTSKETITKIIKEIRNMVKKHKGIDKDALMLINFDEFKDSSLNIFIYIFTNTTVWAEYLQTKEDINLKIMKIIEKHKVQFAFPSQSIYIEQIPKKK